jgi:hypothetical protein
MRKVGSIGLAPVRRAPTRVTPRESLVRVSNPDMRFTPGIGVEVAVRPPLQNLMIRVAAEAVLPRP